MKDQEKTKAELVTELVEMRQRIAELEGALVTFKRREEAEQEALATSEAMIEAFDGFIYVCSPTYEVEFMNERFIQRTGYNPIGKKCYRALHDRDEICPWCVNERVQRGETVRWEIQSPKDNRWYYVVNTPVRHRDGKISKMAMIQDMTERKTEELALQESQERFRRLIDQAADAIFVHDFDGRFLDVNQQGCTSLGYTRDELLSMSVTDVDPDAVPRGDSARFWPNLPATFEARHKRKDGTTFPVEIRLGAIEFGESKVVLAMARDLTDRKKAEEALRESQERLELALEGAELGMWDWNIQTGKLVFNRRWAEMLGYSPDEIRPHIDSWEESIHPEDAERVKESLSRHIAGETPSYLMEYRIATKS